MRESKLARAACLTLYAAALTTVPVLATAADVPAVAAAPAVHERYGQLPMRFERNDGQTDRQVRFLARGIGYSLFLTPGEAVFALRPSSPRGMSDDHSAVPAAPAAVLHVSMHGGNPAPAMEAEGLQPGRANYFRGADPAQWRTDVEQYAKVRYRGVYPGIDLVYYGNQQQLEYDFIVAPRRDPGQIAIDFAGVESLRVNDAGELVLGTPLGEVVQRAPVVYQDIDNTRRLVEGRYRMLGDRRVGFELGGYDRDRALVIDPVLAYNTYIGGSGDEHIAAIAVDDTGNTYVTGSTTSVDFPGSSAFATDGAVDDVFVTKFNAHGNAVVYSAYLGGSRGDFGIGLAVAPNGSAYIAGSTTSSDFPTATAMQPQLRGSEDGFVAKLNAAGNGLVFSTYLGGTLEDGAYAIDLDDDSNAYVAGMTRSSDFPIVDAAQPVPGGVEDGFVTRLSPNGAPLFSTYLGGAGWDVVYGITIDEAGTAYVAGATDSQNFPVMSAYQPFNAGGIDAFMTKLDYMGRIGYSTFFGGSGDDYGRDIDLDRTQTLYIGGYTVPPTSGAPNDFPMYSAHQPVPGGGTDGFIVGFDAGSPYASFWPALVFSTYYGGSGRDVIREVAAHTIGVYTVGDTTSTDLPLIRPTQDASGGELDLFVGTVVYDGELIWSSYFGGSGADYGYAIATLGYGNAYVGGATANTAQPAAGRYSVGSGGAEDAFFVRFGLIRLGRQTYDGDPVADVLWRNNVTGTNAIWLGANSATQQPMASVPSQDWQIAGVGDFNSDYRTDVLWRNQRSGVNAIWLSADAATPKAVATVASQDWQVAGVGDFDGNLDRNDILWRNRRSGANAIWLSADAATPQAVATVASQDWQVAGIGDFNHDYVSDILWRNHANGTNAIWLSGNSRAQLPVVAVPNQDWQVAGIGDFIADSKDDIVWRNQRTGQNVLWLDGTGSASEVLPTVSVTWQIAAIGDYNGDSRADILWRNSIDGRHAIWGSGTPTLPQAMAPVTNQAWQIIK